MTSPRSTKDGPWCWQSKAARRRIREAFDATNNVASALSVYDALCEIASDEGREQFTTTHAWIQRISGVSVSTIKKHLMVLSEVGLISVTTPPLRAPSTYVLLSFASDCPSFANGELALANSSQSGPLATSEERQKKERRTGEDSISPALGIYAFYPRKVAKPEALKAITKALKTATAEYLTERTKAYAEAVSQWPEDQRRFVPHPATWYNRGSYDDDPDTWVREDHDTVGWNSPNPRRPLMR